MPKLVSIIFPTKAKNVNFLIDSLSTLVYQSYQSWEAIVLKPESLDLDSICGFIYSNLKDKLKFIDVSDDLSIGEIRNIGIENSRGSYIAYLDDDDLWYKEYLKTQIDELEQSSADLVYCNYHLRTQNYNNIDNKYNQHFISIPYNINPFNRDVLLTEPFIHLSTTIHTKEISNVIKFEDLNSYEDWMFLLTASKMFRFHSISETLVTIQKRLDNTNNKTSLANESIRNIKYIHKKTEHEIKDEDNIVIRDIIFNQIVKEHQSFTNDEINQMQILIQKRGIQSAFNYLKYVLSIGKIDAHICKKGYEIASALNNKELSDDLLFLYEWYSGIENQLTKNYQPIYFTRKLSRWNASL